VLTAAIEEVDPALAKRFPRPVAGGTAEVGAPRFGNGPAQARGLLPTPPPPGEPVGAGLRGRPAPLPRGWRRMAVREVGVAMSTRLDPLRECPPVRKVFRGVLSAQGTWG
jgi:hypothetical protein